MLIIRLKNKVCHLTETAGPMGQTWWESHAYQLPARLESSITGWGRLVWWTRVRTRNRRDSQANSRSASKSFSSVLNPGNLCCGSSLTAFAMTTTILQQKTGCPSTETVLTKISFILNTNTIILFYNKCRKSTWSPYLELILFYSKSKINICAFYLDSLHW